MHTKWHRWHLSTSGIISETEGIKCVHQQVADFFWHGAPKWKWKGPTIDAQFLSKETSMNSIKMSCFGQPQRIFHKWFFNLKWWFDTDDLILYVTSNTIPIIAWLLWSSEMSDVLIIIVARGLIMLICFISCWTNPLRLSKPTASPMYSRSLERKKFKHFVFYKYFCLVLGLLKPKISKEIIKGLGRKPDFKLKELNWLFFLKFWI